MRGWLLIACVMAWAGPTTGRPIEEIYTYDRLTKEADLVVIGIPVTTVNLKEKLDKNPYDVELVKERTTFKVVGELKGNAPGDKVAVLHYVIVPRMGKGGGPTPILAAPSVLTFRTEPLVTEREGAAVRKPVPVYLMFLKRMKGGEYEPVSGPLNMLPSFRVVRWPDGAD